MNEPAKSNLTIVIRTSHGIVVKSETFSLSGGHEGEGMIGGRTSRQLRSSKALSQRWPFQSLFLHSAR